VSALALPNVTAMSPYKGLASFEDSDVDATFFFGRDREQEIIAANLAAARLTLLYGASGVGKSSVLRAGVVRRLRELPGPLSVVVFDRWRHDPGSRLREAVCAAVGGEFVGSLADTLEAATAHLGGELYVILDGAEEYFVYHGAEREPGTFAADFPDAVTRDGLQAYFLLSLREDSLAALDRFKTRIPNLFANALRLEHLDRSAAREAILGPLEEFNKLTSESPVEIEPELVEAVLDQVARGNVDLGRAGRGVADGAAVEQSVETPFLSLVMERLWEAERNEGSRLLRFRTLERLGGAEQIVRDHLDAALAALAPEGQDAAAEVFNYLVTPSGTKIAHRASDLAEYADVAERELEPTLQRLTSDRILRPVAAADGSTQYEIFHDVLAGAVLAWRTRHRSERELKAERATAARRQRRAAVVGALAAAVIAVLTAATVYALVQRSNARTEARKAHAGELVAQARAELGVHPVRSVELALRAARLEPSPQMEETLRTALRGLYLDALFRMDGPVASVQFSPNGRLLVAAAGGEARVIRVRDRKIVRRLKHGGPVTGAWFAPDMRFVLTAGEGGVARAWALATGRLLYRIRHDERINSVTFSGDGRVFATASDDRTARIWRASDGRLLRALPHPRPVMTTSFDRAGDLLATAATDRFARVFDVATGRLVSRLDHGGWITDVTFAPRGVLLATGGADKTAKIWNARTGKRRLVLPGHKARVLDVEFDATGDRLVTASADQAARIWDTHTGDLLAKLFGNTNQIQHARFSPDGRSVVTASSDRTARVFHQEGWLQTTLAGHTDTVKDAIFSPDGETVATAGRDGTVRLWRWRPRPYLQTVAVHRGPVVAEEFTDARRLVSVGSDGRVAVWPAGGGSVAWFGKASQTVSASIGGNRVVVVSSDGTARVWQVPDRLLGTIQGPTGTVLAAVAGRVVATADARGVVRLRDIGTGRVLDSADAGARLTQLALSGDGRHLLAAGRDGIARLWRIGDGRLQARHDLRGHRGAITAAAFSPDGRRVVTAGDDHTARIWKVASGTPEQVLTGHRKALTSAAFSPDGRLLVTTSYDQDSRLWDVATGRRLSVLRVHYGSVNDAAFTPDSRWVVTAGGGGAGVFNATTGRILYILSTHDTLPLKAATSPSGWRIAIGGTDGRVETYDCRLCGDLQQLLVVASERLKQLRATP
jgi:WD40 repeat protein